MNDLMIKMAEQIPTTGDSVPIKAALLIGIAAIVIIVATTIITKKKK